MTLPYAVFDLDEFAAQLAPLGNCFAHAERRRFAQNHLAEFVRVRFRAQNGEQDAGPVFLHLNRRVKNVQRAGGQRRFDKRAENFAGAIVEIGFQHGDAVGFPIQM